MNAHKNFILILLFLCITSISCQKDINIESEVVAQTKQIKIFYYAFDYGHHTVSFYANSNDLLAGENPLLSLTEEVFETGELVTFMIKNVEASEIFIGLNLSSGSLNTEQLYKYEKSILMPNYNVLVEREIKQSEWIKI